MAGGFKNEHNINALGYLYLMCIHTKFVIYNNVDLELIFPIEIVSTYCLLNVNKTRIT